MSRTPAKRRLALRASLTAIFMLAAIVVSSLPCRGENYEGIDKSIIEKAAEKAGRPATEPVINTDKGDLLLFLFLCAGAVGGFIMGYTFRGLFGKGARSAAPADDNPGERRGA